MLREARRCGFVRRGWRAVVLWRRVRGLFAVVLVGWGEKKRRKLGGRGGYGFSSSSSGSQGDAGDGGCGPDDRAAGGRVVSCDDGNGSCGRVDVGGGGGSGGPCGCCDGAGGPDFGGGGGGLRGFKKVGVDWRTVEFESKDMMVLD